MLYNQDPNGFGTCMYQSSANSAKHDVLDAAQPVTCANLSMEMMILKAKQFHLFADGYGTAVMVYDDTARRAI